MLPEDSWMELLAVEVESTAWRLYAGALTPQDDVTAPSLACK